MNPPDRTPSPSPGTPPGRVAPHQDDREGRVTPGMRRQLGMPPAEEDVRFGARRQPPPNPGGPENAFAVAAAMQHARPAAISAPVAHQPQTIDVMVSVSDGMIGSIYLQGSRIRTTHNKGPKMTVAEQGQVHRFNLDLNGAEAAFIAANPNVTKVVAAACDPTLSGVQRTEWIELNVHKARKHWVSAELRDSDPTPDWAQRITGPESVPYIDEPRASVTDRRLFEIYDATPDHRVRVHMSRGEMVRMTLPVQTMSAVEAALQQIEHEPDPERRNEVFFEYLETHASDLADRIRRP